MNKIFSCTSPWYTFFTTPETLETCLRVILFFSILCFPIGRFFQIAGPLAAIPFMGLLIWKKHPFPACVRHPLFSLFSLLFLCIAFQIVLSHWRALSWSTVSPNLYRGYLLPFIAMSCIRTEKDLRLMIYACLGATGIQGLDGIWQYVSGYDLIKHAPIMAGRLTASMGTYRVGDYMGILLLPCFAAWYLLPAAWSPTKKTGVLFLLLLPALFLWIFAQARTGYLALLGSLYLTYFFILRRPTLITTTGPIALLCLLVCFGPHRISLETMLSDGRIPIWKTAWETFQHAPFLGWGAGTFIPAYQSQGYVIEEGLMQHPHNIYLQLLVDGGLLSFLAMLTFFISITIWSARRIFPGVKREQSGALKGRYWHLALFFWAGWIAFLIVGVSGHDFYRTWYVSSGFTMLGIMLAACLHGPSIPVKLSTTQGQSA